MTRIPSTWQRRRDVGGTTVPGVLAIFRLFNLTPLNIATYPPFDPIDIPRCNLIMPQFMYAISRCNLAMLHSIKITNEVNPKWRALPGLLFFRATVAALVRSSRNQILSTKSEILNKFELPKHEIQNKMYPHEAFRPHDGGIIA